MAGAIALLVVMLTVIPVSIFVLGLVISGAFSWSLPKDAEERYEGSELVELNK
jgi:hypothetical protein